MEQERPSRGKAQAIVHYFGQLDMFRVVQDQENCLTSASTAGAIVSTVTAFFITVLMIQETYLFFRGEVRSSMFVPSPKVKQEQMEPVHLIVSFPEMSCDMVGVAIVDQHGNMLPDLMRPSTAFRTRLDPLNYKREIGVYKDGPVDPKEGCRVIASIMIDKVPGHFLVGALNQRGGSPQSVNPKHIIHEMWIGNERLDKAHDNIAEDLVNPLRNHTSLTDPRGTMYKFYLQVVPTYFRNDRGGKVKKLGYQYTASTTKVMAPHMPPGLYFSHRHSTLAVEYRYHYETWSHFLVSLCAIVGGVFTVMSFISSALEALGETPTIAKGLNFIANYLAGRRKAAPSTSDVRPTLRPVGMGSTAAPPLHTPHMPMLHSTSTSTPLGKAGTPNGVSTASSAPYPASNFQSMGSYPAPVTPMGMSSSGAEQRHAQSQGVYNQQPQPGGVYGQQQASMPSMVTQPPYYGGNPTKTRTD